MIWMIPLAMAAMGMLADKKHPLRGAALGAAAGMTGGAALGALGAGAAGAGAAGAAGASSAGMAGAGLLGAEGASTAGASLLGAEGAGAATLGESALSGSGLLGAGGATPGIVQGATVAEQAAAPVIDMSSKAGLFDTMNHTTGGLLGNASDAFTKYAKPINATMKAAEVGQQMAGPEPAPPPPPQMRNVPLDLSGLLNHSQEMQQYDLEDQLRKRQKMNQYVQNIGRF